MLAHVRPMPNEQLRVYLVYDHAWIGYGHLYFVVYGDSIFCLICMDMTIKFFVWLKGYSIYGKSLVGFICHKYFIVKI